MEKSRVWNSERPLRKFPSTSWRSSTVTGVSVGAENRDGGAGDNSGPASQRPHGPLSSARDFSCTLVIDMDGSPRGLDH